MAVLFTVSSIDDTDGTNYTLGVDTIDEVLHNVRIRLESGHDKVRIERVTEKPEMPPP